MTTTTGRPALPVSQTVSEAFHTVPANWPAVLRIFWPWLPLTGATMWLQLAAFPGSLPGSVQEGELPTVPSLTTIMLWLLLIVAGMLLFSSTAVAWHRFILLGERPAIVPGLDRPVLRYLARFFLIGLSAMPIMLLSGLVLVAPSAWLFLPPSIDPIAPPSTVQLLAMAVVGLVAIVPALFVVARLSVALPGIALGRVMTLSESWQKTAGNASQLLGGTLLVYVPAYAFSQGVTLAMGSATSILSMMALHLLVNALVSMAALSFLTLSYRHIVAPNPARSEVG